MKRQRQADFRDILKSISHAHDAKRVFDAFVRLAACALAAQTREPEYLEEAKRWERAELDQFGQALGALVLEMESKPFEDVLGSHYMESAVSRKGQQWRGEFHTPKPVCDLIARMTLAGMEPLPTDRPITVMEPACGAGAMILSLAEAVTPEVRRRLRVTAIDISRTACDMAFVNTTLWGIPTRVIHGNTLSREYWAAWSNIHRIMPWLPLAMRNQAPEAKKQGQPPTPPEVERIKASLVQQELAL